MRSLQPNSGSLRVVVLQRLRLRDLSITAGSGLAGLPLTTDEIPECTPGWALEGREQPTGKLVLELQESSTLLERLVAASNDDVPSEHCLMSLLATMITCPQRDSGHVTHRAAKRPWRTCGCGPSAEP